MRTRSRNSRSDTRHADRVHGALRRFGLGTCDAEEVAQEVFLRAWQRLEGFEQRARLSTWLYRITFNEAHRRLAWRRPSPVAPDLDGEAQRDAAPGSAHLGPRRGRSTANSRRPFRARSRTCAEWREAVVLRDVEGLSTKEASAVAGVRQPAFRSRLHRGRMQLRTLLEPYLDQ